METRSTLSRRSLDLLDWRIPNFTYWLAPAYLLAQLLEQHGLSVCLNLYRRTINSVAHAGHLHGMRRLCKIELSLADFSRCSATVNICKLTNALFFGFPSIWSTSSPSHKILPIDSSTISREYCLLTLRPSSKYKTQRLLPSFPTYGPYTFLHPYNLTISSNTLILGGG